MALVITLARIGAVASLVLLTNACGGATPSAETAADDDGEVPLPPPRPPPPPSAPPPSAPAPDARAPSTSPAGAAPSPPAQPPQPTAPPQSSGEGPLPPLPSQAPKYAPAPDDGAPPAAEWTVVHPSGQWVFTSEYGWIWVPNGAGSVAVEGTPYVYLYTPSYGWTWYVSPWGIGPYRYGVWVRHPWHPVGWRGGWVAHPNVVVRIGGHPHGGRRGGHSHRR